MFSLRYYAAALLFVPAVAMGQTYEDALRFNRNDLNGTARSQSMAGAFGAVGADLSAMAINPAGMGLYRASEVGMSLGVNVNKTESDYFGVTTQDDKIKVPFSQLGAAFSFGLQRDNTKGLVNSCFYVGYNRLADYASREHYRDPFAYNSLLDYFCTNEQAVSAMTGALAYDAYLTNDTVNSEGKTFSYNIWERLNPDLTIDDTFRSDEQGLGLIAIDRKVENGGSKGDFAIGYAANVSHRFFIGGSINIQSFGFEQTITHSEYFDSYPVNGNDPVSFAYRSWLDQTGTGVNFKLGVIVRPVDALRFGFALTSPTFSVIKERYSSEITNTSMGNVYSSGEFEYEYRYRVPSRFVASVAWFLGKDGMISVDFERTNHSRSKFSQMEEDEYGSLLYADPFEAANNVIKDHALQASNTIRIGAELSTLSPLYLRGGFRLTSSPLKSDFCVMENKERAGTGGIGFRHNNFFVDVAYVGTVRKSDAWVLPDCAEGYIYEENKPGTLTHRTHSGVLTLGFRF